MDEIAQLAADHFAKPHVWVPVASSNVAAVAFWLDTSDPSGSILGVWFKAKPPKQPEREYFYKGVPLALFRELLIAPSKGTFLHKNVYETYQVVHKK